MLFLPLHIKLIRHVKNETKNCLEKDRNSRSDQALTEVKNKLASSAVSGGPHKNNKKNDDDDDPNKKRIVNKTTKTEFFQKIKDEYEYWQNGIYKRKPRCKGVENAEYLKWDHCHNDVEAYSKGQVHLGSINPHTFKLYKPPVIPRAML